jgi:hypothetical protein
MIFLLPLVVDGGLMALFFVLERQAIWQQRGRPVIVATDLVLVVFIGICTQQRATMQAILSVVVVMSGRPMGDLRPATDATKEQRTTAVVTSRYHWRVVLVIAVDVLWFRSNIQGLLSCEGASHRLFENNIIILFIVARKFEVEKNIR